MTLPAAIAGCPIASENLQFEETGTDVIVFDPALQSFHLLNQTAHCILKACNGSSRIENIASIVALQFNCPDMTAVLNDVSETLIQFREKGLVMFVVDDQSLAPSAERRVEEGALLAISVTGTSMFPVLLSGDKALVKQTRVEDLKTGDIIVWTKQSSTLVAHRIISLDVSQVPPLIQTKGDLVIEPDAPIEKDQLIGKIVAVLRGGQVQWLRQIDSGPLTGTVPQEQIAQPPAEPLDEITASRRPSFSGMKVLDLREISVESIRNIGFVKDISLVLLSPENAAAWAEVETEDVKTVITADADYRVYTGQPELVPELLEFIQEPLRLLVSGQIFLTAFSPDQILKTFDHLIISGQAFVSSEESRAALESITTFLSSAVRVVPREHVRWIGESLLGPEYTERNGDTPLIAVGDLRASERLEKIPEAVSQFNTVEQLMCKSADGQKQALPLV